MYYLYCYGVPVLRTGSSNYYSQYSVYSETQYDEKTFASKYMQVTNYCTPIHSVLSRTRSSYESTEYMYVLVIYWYPTQHQFTAIT